MSAMWPEPPDPGRGYPQQRWRRSPWRAWVVTVLAVLGWLVVLGCVGLAFWVRPVLP